MKKRREYRNGWLLVAPLMIGLPLILLLSYLIALLLKQQAGKHMLLKSVLLFPYIMPIAGTVLLTDVVFGETGVANRILMLAGIPIGNGWRRRRRSGS